VLPAGGRDLPTALATAAIVVVLALVCFSLGEGPTAWLAAVIGGLASLELCFELRRQGLHTATPLVLASSVGLVVAAYEYGPAAYPVVGAVTVVSALLWFLWRVTPGRPVVGVATSVFAFAYVGGLAGFAGLMLQSPDGVGLVLGMVLCVVASDVFGYFVGSQFGKSPVAPAVSPHKTIEGTVASVLGSMVVGWLLVGAIHPWDRTSGLVLGVLVAFGALVGDLSESMLKRDLGIKDFGTTLPGHGGALDRFDALLFCLPIAYYLALHLDYV
jgi:phosphatidate cytidylyltransferase